MRVVGVRLVGTALSTVDSVALMSPPLLHPPPPRSLSLSHFPPLDRSEGFYADAGVLGVHGLTGRYLIPPADKLDEAEQAAMIAAVKSELVVPQDPTSTVKINIAWTENDYELDIATEDGQSKSPLQPIICSRTLMGCSDNPPSAFSRGGSLLPFIYADARYIDAVIVSKVKPSTSASLIALQTLVSRTSCLPRKTQTSRTR